MSGAARSSTMLTSYIFPQKPVNQRPTIALLSLSFDISTSPIMLSSVRFRDTRTLDFASRSDTPFVVLEPDRRRFHFLLRKANCSRSSNARLRRTPQRYPEIAPFSLDAEQDFRQPALRD